MREETPPSPVSEALLFFQPVTTRSSEPPWYVVSILAVLITVSLREVKCYELCTDAEPCEDFAIRAADDNWRCKSFLALVLRPAVALPTSFGPRLFGSLTRDFFEMPPARGRGALPMSRSPSRSARACSFRLAAIPPRLEEVAARPRATMMVKSRAWQMR